MFEMSSDRFDETKFSVSVVRNIMQEICDEFLVTRANNFCDKLSWHE